MTTPAGVETDLGWALGTVMRTYLRMADARLAGIPGGPRGYQVLASASDPELNSQLALAKYLGVDRTVMTYLIDDLEGAGLVARVPDPADRRARRIELTDAGTERLCQLERSLREAEEHLLGALEPEEREVLRTLLHRLATRGEQQHNACDVADMLDSAGPAGPPAAPTRRKRRR
ncbi:MarR family winged helix-turn-helix transcriptional regulator [Pseudonocardia sp. TRM90224]|uniref:MarR family winged helix-turn-helix transcriptional regulator n=1 Tax=Pseudonocardia sp. TRM90224 TaxID=2812678 RepID=UPI001E436433|nr:MarR family transcriptional regulator [Pseudonocardia sp. TRM90224]